MNKVIKTNKIAPGYYKGSYKNVDFTIIKIDNLQNGQIAWYWQIKNNKVHDWYKTKFQAIQSVKSYIDHLK